MNDWPLIYFIDDDDAICDAARLFLEGEGIKTKTFPDGESFLDAIENASRLPDCIISDLRVSDADGDDIVNLLSTMEAAIPVIVLSSEPALLRSHALSRRVIAALKKPVNPDRLLQAVRVALAVE
jgi:two-component system response regulator AtoC